MHYTIFLFLFLIMPLAAMRKGAADPSLVPSAPNSSSFDIPNPSGILNHPSIEDSLDSRHGWHEGSVLPVGRLRGEFQSISSWICPVEGCSNGGFNFAHEKSLKIHLKKYHPPQVNVGLPESVSAHYNPKAFRTAPYKKPVAIPSVHLYGAGNAFIYELGENPCDLGQRIVQDLSDNYDPTKNRCPLRRCDKPGSLSTRAAVIKHLENFHEYTLDHYQCDALSFLMAARYIVENAKQG